MTNRDKLPHVAIGLGIGIAVGIGLGVLFAPGSGEETRDYLTENVKDTIDQAASTGRRLKRRAARAVDDFREDLRGAAVAGERAYQDAQDA